MKVVLTVDILGKAGDKFILSGQSGAGCATRSGPSPLHIFERDVDWIHL